MCDCSGKKKKCSGKKAEYGKPAAKPAGKKAPKRGK